MIGGSAGVQTSCDGERSLNGRRCGSTGAGERSGAAGCAGVETVMGWAVSIVGLVRLGGATGRKAVAVTIAVGALWLWLLLWLSAFPPLPAVTLLGLELLGLQRSD